MQFNEEVQVQEMERSEPEGPVTINEDTIDRCLSMLQEADPSGELRPDNPEMALLEGRLFLLIKMFSKCFQKAQFLLHCVTVLHHSVFVTDECRRMTPLIDQELEEIDRLVGGHSHTKA